MPSNAKNSDEQAKKGSFWEKLSQKKTAGKGSSLVSAIIHQAEKEAGTKESAPSQVEELKSESADKQRALSNLSNAKTLLSFIIILSFGVWIYFFAMLHESNYIHAQFEKENLTTELSRKTDISQQLKTDIRDTEKFSKLLKIEELSNQILTIDLEDPILNYEKPEGERVISRENPTEILIKTLNADNKFILLKESDVLALDSARETRVEKTLGRLTAISQSVQELAQGIKVNAEIEDKLATLTTEVQNIDLEKQDFPSASLKNRFSAVQVLAKEILRQVKKVNLENLVADIKKQAQAIDTSGSSEETKGIVESLQTSLDKISAQKPSSFGTAVQAIDKLNITAITENDIYQKVVRIIGDPKNENSESDLITAATIAPNLDRINTIDDLRAERINWSNIVSQTEKIARLGADLERDTEGTPLDASRDIDPDGKLVMLLSYSGRSNKNDIEIRGKSFATDSYDEKSFSLLADLIDAFEGSKYFKDVSGFSFSKTEDRQGNVSSPLNFKMTVQDPFTVDKRDVKKVERPKARQATVLDTEDLEDLEEIDFSLSDSAATETETTDSAEESSMKPSASKSEGEFVNVFNALDQIFHTASQ